MELDYALDTTESRIAHINTLNLSHYTPYQLEIIANYLLYFTKQKSPTPKTPSTKTTELSEPINVSTSRYTNPKPEIDWNCPHLQPLYQAREIITQLEQAEITLNGKTKYAYFLRHWRIELSMDSTHINNAYHSTLPPAKDYIPHSPIEVEDTIDFTNSFHIKQLILHYSALRQSPDSKFTIEYLDQIIENTPFQPWQKHLLVRRIDGVNQITIGRELAEDFGKIISPSYMSTAMRTIYTRIAKTAKQLQLEHENRNNPSCWKECPTCHRILYNNKYYWYAKRKACKECEDKK